MIKKLWHKIPRRTRFWINAVICSAIFITVSFGFGTFYPNKWIKDTIVQATEDKMVSEWNDFGFTKPSIEYNNNIEFVKAVGKCIEYINLHKQHSERIHKDIIIAMAVLETGWGKSRFAKEANNLFGIRTWDPKVPQLKPLELPDADFGVKKYPTKCDSVEDMISVINKHPAYEDFRLERSKQLTTGIIDIDAQIDLLSKWSTNPEYTKLVKNKVKTIADILAK